MRWILLIRQNVDENTKRKFCYKALSGYGTISQFFNIEQELFKMKRYFFSFEDIRLKFSLIDI